MSQKPTTKEPPKEQPKKQTSEPGVKHQKGEGFTQRYANNTLFETSNWDLKIIFGQTDASISPNMVVQHTAMTVPWPQAKTMIYFMSVNLAMHEANFGRIQIPAGLIPAVPEEMPQIFRDQGTSDETWQKLRQIYLEFITENPESAPK